jgi:hypothetical protein
MHAAASLRKPGRARDSRAMFFVRYKNGSSTVVRVAPETTARPIWTLAREWQARGQIPPGEIGVVIRFR